MEDITNKIHHTSHESISRRKLKSQNMNTIRQLPPIRDVPKIPLSSNKEDDISTRRSVSPIRHSPTKRTLNNKRSRLDLLDNSHLTSFPLAPPPLKLPHKALNSSKAEKSPEYNSEETESKSRPNSALYDCDPIVLVEDYIRPRNLARKKLSVSDLKSSIKTFDFNSQGSIQEQEEDTYLVKAKTILSSSLEFQQTKELHENDPSSLLLTNCLVEEDEDVYDDAIKYNDSFSSSEFFSAKTSQSTLPLPSQVSTIKPTSTLTFEHDQPFASFSVPKSTSSLKYCVICETPLYDLSSHLTSDDTYSEFVCCNCTEKYEALTKLLENFDESIAYLNPLSGDIEDIEEALSQPSLKRQKNDTNGFSINLKNRLQSQLDNRMISSISNMSSENKKYALWLLEAKRKLRWRWRISGLLPKLLTKNDD